MNLLAIECSHPSASLCLYQDGEMTVHESWHAIRNHDAYLFPALDKALAQLCGASLDFILVGAGPGSYGGVRVAIAAATGLQLVLGGRVVSIDSWAQLTNEGAAIISDAKRGAWTYRDPEGVIEVKSSEELLELQASGLRFSTLEDMETLSRAGLKASTYGLVPNAEGLILSWLGFSSEQQEKIMLLPPSPIYVRPPNITKAKRKPWEH